MYRPARPGCCGLQSELYHVLDTCTNPTQRAGTDRMPRLKRAHLVSLSRIRPSLSSMLMQRAMGEEAMQMGAAFDPHSAFRLGAYSQGPPALQTLLRQRLAAQQQVTPCSHNVTKICNSVFLWRHTLSKQDSDMAIGTARLFLSHCAVDIKSDKSCCGGGKLHGLSPCLTASAWRTPSIFHPSNEDR